MRETQEEIEAHGEWNELNVLLRDFAEELVKRRVLSREQFVVVELTRVEESLSMQTQDGDARHKLQMFQM